MFFACKNFMCSNFTWEKKLLQEMLAPPPPPPLPPISLRPLFITSMYHLMRNSDMGFDLSCGMKVEINRKSSKGKFTPFSVSFLEVERPSKSEH